MIVIVQMTKVPPCCRCTAEELEKYGIHLLAMSHVYYVPQLKQRCTKVLVERLTIENVVDVLQLARMCDAPDLYLKCMKLVANNFKTVEKTEGWQFLQDHDPWLELQILQFMDEAESVNHPYSMFILPGNSHLNHQSSQNTGN